jgi:hypothetical protein
LNNNKIFLYVCLGIWTTETVEAYNLEDICAMLSLDGADIKNDEKNELPVFQCCSSLSRWLGGLSTLIFPSKTTTAALNQMN